MSYNFNTNYVLDPWEGITQNERSWYDETLREMYIRNAVYSPYALMKVDLNKPRARTIYFDELIPPRPNIAPIGNREMNATRMYTDSYRRSVTTERHGNGMSLHRESEMFSYWQANGRAGLREIIQQAIGQTVVDHMDILARNAFFKHPFPMFGGGGSASSFATLPVVDANRLTTDILDSIWLGMHDRKVPWAALPLDDHTGDILTVTSYGALYDLKREVDNDSFAANKFVNISEYGNPAAVLAGEVGTYRQTRFLGTGLSILWNAGVVDTQTAIKVAVAPGDGAPDPTDTAVDGIRFVGQPDATHSITVASTAGFEVGDKVTVHKLRFTLSSGLGLTNPNLGVVNGLDWTDPMAQDMVITEVADATHLVFEEPYMMTGNAGAGLETDLGGTVFGYITKATNIHTALFLSRQFRNGVIAGFAQTPKFYTPPAVDDYESIYRISYDFWAQYKPWDPQVYQVAFLVGSNNHKGQLYTR